MIPVNHIPLFITPAKFEAEKVAEFKLSDNVNGWDSEIITHINEDIPYLAKVPYEINLKKIDKELGYAMGAVVLKLDGTNASIPLIIKKRKLQSLDVLMIGEDEAVPLTEDSIMSLVQKKQQLGKLIDVKNNGIVDRVISGTSDESGHMPPNTGKYTFSSVKNVNKEDLDEYNKLINDESIKAAAFATGFLKKNLQVGQRAKVPGAFMPRMIGVKKNPLDIKKVAGVKLSVNTNLNTLEKTGSAMIVDVNNEIHKGLFINNIKTLDGEKVAQSLFITDKGYAYQQKIAGKAIDYKVSGNSDYSIGDEVVFVINGEATEPVKIASKLNNEKIVCANHMGRGFTVYLTDVKNITKTASGYLVPKKATIIKLGKRISARENDEALVKMASAKGNKTYITVAPECNSFSNEKIGTFHNLSDLRMMTLMNGFYTNGVELMKVGSHVISGIHIEQIKQASVRNIPKLSMEDTVKLAASLSDPDSVDAVLALGFVNEENIHDFVEMIPEFEEVINKLARLLISIRLGMQGDQNVVKHAMKYLQKVMDNLKALR